MGSPKSLLDAIAKMFISIRAQSKLCDADPIWHELDAAAEAALNFALLKEFGPKFQIALERKAVIVRAPGATPELQIFGEL